MCPQWCEALSSRTEVSEIRRSSSSRARAPRNPISKIQNVSKWLIFDSCPNDFRPRFHICEPPPRFVLKSLDFLQSMTSEIKCFDVPQSCPVFLEFLDVHRMLPGLAGHDSRNLHSVWFSCFSDYLCTWCGAFSSRGQVSDIEAFSRKWVRTLGNSDFKSQITSKWRILDSDYGAKRSPPGGKLQKT